MKILIVATSLLLSLAVPGHAQIISDAGKLGANAGAMNFCRDNFMTDDDNGRYGLLVAATTKDFSALGGEDKAKALITKKAAEDGDYLGKPLDGGRCQSVRKLLLAQYSID